MKYFIYFLIFFLTFNVWACFNLKQIQATTEEGELPEKLESIMNKIRMFFEEIFQKALTILKKIFNGLKENFFSKTKDWLQERKEGIKQGLEEEKEEFKEGIYQTFSKLWQKLWQKIKNTIETD